MTDEPFDVFDLLEPALSAIVAGLADRGVPTEKEYETRSDGIWKLVLALQPRDGIEVMLTGQLIGFNGLFAEGLRDLMRGGMPSAMKVRAQSSLVAMGRLTLGHVDRLEKRDIQPYRAGVTEPEKPKVEKPAARVAEAPSAARVPEPCPDIEAAPPSEETSWLDEPLVQWLVESPADVAARIAKAQAEAPPIQDTAARDNGPPDPATPRRPSAKERMLEAVGD